MDSGLSFECWLRQVRTVKFMNKLNQLKSRDGFEGFGSIISLFR